MSALDAVLILAKAYCLALAVLALILAVAIVWDRITERRWNRWWNQ